MPVIALSQLRRPTERSKGPPARPVGAAGFRLYRAGRGHCHLSSPGGLQRHQRGRDRSPRTWDQNAAEIIVAKEPATARQSPFPSTGRASSCATPPERSFAMSERLAAAGSVRPAGQGPGGGGLFRRGGLHRPVPLAAGPGGPPAAGAGPCEPPAAGEGNPSGTKLPPKPLPRAGACALPCCGRMWRLLPGGRAWGWRNAAGRSATGFFHSLAPGEEDRILTAHHAGDNAETVLLHPVPGSFPARAAGHFLPGGERCCGPFCGCPAGRLRPIAGKTGWPM